MGAYVDLMRPQWTIASTLAVVLAIWQAWAQSSFHPLVAAAVVSAAFVSHAFMETWDEISDFRAYRSSLYVDGEHPETLFAGGSGVLTSRRLSPRQALRFFSGLVGVYVALVTVIVGRTGPPYLLFVAVGLFFIFGYSSRLKLSYRGLGELVNFFCFGPVLVLSAYVAIRLADGPRPWDPVRWDVLSLLDPTIVQISVVLGLLWFGGIHVQNMKDFDEDLAAGKRTLVVRFGKPYASRVPLCSAIGVAALTTALVADDLWFLLAAPGAILFLVESARFWARWRTPGFFADQITRFFVYRDFVCIGAGFVASYVVRPAPEGLPSWSRGYLLALTVAGTLPALVYLIRQTGAPGDGVDR